MPLMDWISRSWKVFHLAWKSCSWWIRRILDFPSACNPRNFPVVILVFFCTWRLRRSCWNHNRHTFGYYIGDQTVQQGRLCGDSICTNRYFAAILLLCHHSEMDFLHQSWMVRPVWYRRAYAWDVRKRRKGTGHGKAYGTSDCDTHDCQCRILMRYTVPTCWSASTHWQ